MKVVYRTTLGSTLRMGATLHFSTLPFTTPETGLGQISDQSPFAERWEMPGMRRPNKCQDATVFTQAEWFMG